MNEHDGRGPTPEAWSDDDVRRLLAETSLEGPDDGTADGVPADVAARLDDVLAGLVAGQVAERTSDAAPKDDVTHLDARRHQRPRRRVLAGAGIAAAAVVAAGVLGIALLPELGGNNATITAGDLSSEASGEADSRAVAPADLPSRAPLAGSLRVRSDHLEADTRDLVAAVVPVAAAAADESAGDFASEPTRAASTAPLTADRARSLLGCTVGGGPAYAVGYDGRAAQAVVDQRETDAPPVVRIYVCDAEGEPVEVDRVTLSPTP